MRTLPDDVLEATFGPPLAAAVDLHELRVWCHGRTSIQPTDASAKARQMLAEMDPTWPSRALTNERVTVPPGRRPRGYGLSVEVAESTLEAMSYVAETAKAHPSTRTYSSKKYETLWPAQYVSWSSWVGMTLDLADIDDETARLMRRHTDGLDDLILPAQVQVWIRQGGTPWLDATADAMGPMTSTLWKHAAIPHPGLSWFDGLAFFERSWLDAFADGALAMYLRAIVTNGWATSTQLANIMNLETARSCRESWI